MRRFVLAGLAALVSTVALPAGANAAEPPTFTLGSVCEGGGSIATGELSGLQPGVVYGAQLEISNFGTLYIPSIQPDSAGEYFIGSVPLTYPLTVSIVVYLNPDQDYVQDPGEATVLQGTVRAEQPCHAPITLVARPTTKEQCKDGGWRTYSVFKNQGDCVSYIATGTRNQPAA